MAMKDDEDDFKFPDEAQDAADDSAGIETEISTGDAGELEIEVVDDVPEADRGRKALDKAVDDPSDDELKEYSTKVQARIKDLTHARHDERRRADLLQRERDELDAVVKRTLAERDAMRGQYVKGAEILSNQTKALVEKEVEEAAKELEAAHEAFDTAAIVKAQMKLNDAQLKRSQIQNFRAPPSQQQESVVESRSQVQTAAPNLDDKTSRWLSKNKWFGEAGDAAMTGYALGLHQQLVKKHGEGFTRTDEYYSQIDAAVRQTFPTHFKPKASTERQSAVVAPNSRTQALRKVTLTSTQVALAKRYGLTNQQYAAELVKLEK